MKKAKLTRSLMAAVSIVALSAVMYGCVHSDDNSTPAVEIPEAEETAYEAGKAAIMAATTAEAVRDAYDAVDQDAISGAERASLEMARDSRLETLATAARAAMQRTALTTAAGNVDTSDLTTADAIAAATMAINALKAAIAAATDIDDTSMYQSQVEAAEMAVREAQTGLDTQGRMMAQRRTIMNAVTMARTAVAGVDDASTASEVASADAAIKALQDAIDGAADLPEGHADVASAKGTLETLKGTLSAAKTSRNDAIAKAEKAKREADAKLGKALRAALGGPQAGGNALANIGAPTLSAVGLAIDAAAGAGALPDTGDGSDPDSVTLMAGDSAGKLSSWAGMDYADTMGTGAAMVTNEARVYTNQGPGTREAFADALPDDVAIATANAGGTVPANVNPATTAIAGYIAISSGGTVTTGLSFDNVMADDFTHSGIQTHAIPDQRNSVSFRGTYNGAPGEYRCVTGCSSTNDGTGSPSALGGTWFFKPDAGAMVHEPDAHYLYYGWWVSKDNEDNPTAASAFAGRVGADPNNSTDGLDPGWSGGYTAGTTLTGSASYVGSAAGKFAIDNVLDGTGHGGHFTADVILEATFSSAVAADVGITGTIDEFRLNDGSDDPGWSVSLHQGAFGADGAITGSTADATNTTADGTTWSFGDNAAPESGSWSGTMYDEAVTGDDDDGNNIPTTVTGTFYSEFSTIGRMVGAFGANRDEDED